MVRTISITAIALMLTIMMIGGEVSGSNKPLFDPAELRFTPAQTMQLLEIRELINSGLYDEAQERATELLSVSQEDFGETSSEVAEVTNLLAELCVTLGQYQEAVNLRKRSLTLVKNLPAVDQVVVAELSYDLASLYFEQGLNSEAKALCEQALQIYDSALGPNHPNVASCLNNIALICYEQGLYFKAEPLFEKVKAIQEESLGPNHPHVATVSRNLAGLYAAQGRYSNAEPLYEKALVIFKEALGPDHPDVATTLNGLAGLYIAQGRYSYAEPLYEKALDIFKEALGPDHPDVATILNNLAQLYAEQGLYAKAEPLYERALTISEHSLGPDHPSVAQSLNNLAKLYLDQGLHANAEPLYERALTITEKSLGPDHPDVATILNNLAQLYAEQGLYAKAEPLLERALKISEYSLGPDHPKVATILGNLAQLYAEQGLYAKAEPLYERALTISEHSLGPDHPSVAQSLNNLAELYKAQGLYEKAEPLLERALTIRRKSLGPDHPDVATILNNLALLYAEQGLYAKAEPLYERALTISEHSLGPDHPSVATCLNNLALLYEMQGLYKNAEPLYNKALGLRQKRLSPSHPDVATSLNNLAYLYRAQVRPNDALGHAKTALKIRLMNFSANAYSLSENDLLSYGISLRTALWLFVSCSQETPVRQVSSIGNAIVSTKGLVEDIVSVRQHALTSRLDPEADSLLNLLRATRTQLANLFVSGHELETADYRSRIVSLNDAAKSLEVQFARISPDFRSAQSISNVSCIDIQSNLLAQSAVVELIRYYHFEPKGGSAEPRYLALILKKEVEPVVINLGQAGTIDSVLFNSLWQMMQMDTEDIANEGDFMKSYSGLLSDLYSHVWQPLERHLTDKEIVFIAPDGPLHLLPFGILPADDSTFLIEKHAIHYLGTGRDIVRLQSENEEYKPGSGFFAMGDPDYNASPSGRLTAPPIDESDLFALRGSRRSDCDEFRSFTVNRLPATRSEIEQAASHWTVAHNDEPAYTYFDTSATEDVFKANAPSSRVIHLSTHGYYLADQCQPEEPPTQRDMFLTNSDFDARVVGENPLLLSGLLFAGANLHGEGADSLGVDDGILSAYEVSALDLTGTELVVLSACETGLGAITQGEGVYGLRRAFQMAGARTVVSSLWPVSDQFTADMMAALYEDMDKPIYQRMREVQLKQIENLRTAGLPPHPFLWGAFIATGDWR